MKRILAPVSLVITLACSPDSNPATGPTQRTATFAAAGGTIQPNMTEEGCRATPGCWPGDDGGEGNPGADDGRVTGDAPSSFNFGDDPSFAAPGRWIGMADTDCYTNMPGGNSSAQDIDQDLLADECEYRLAWSFAPDLMMSGQEQCGGGEPYWAAKYFDDPDQVGWGRFVRVAYLLSYYDDCGAGGHHGDSEFIDVQITYNPGTRHWELQKLFTSAHFLAENSNSRWHNWQDVTFPAGRPRAYPVVWVSTNKHANYNNPGCGDALQVTFDECIEPYDAGRVKVYQYHNIGQPLHPMVDCTASINPAFWLNGTMECFQSGSDFRGWHPDYVSNATAYRVSLHTYAHDCWSYDGSGSNCYWGPAGWRN